MSFYSPVLTAGFQNDKKCGEPTMRLSFDEVVHIRQVLARAQLEKYQSSKDLYQALKNEKVKDRSFYSFKCESKARLVI